MQQDAGPAGPALASGAGQCFLDQAGHDRHVGAASQLRLEHTHDLAHILGTGGAGGGHGSGHLGEAYGLTAILAFDPARRIGVVCVIGGTGFDPAKAPGEYSSLFRHEERILTAVYRHVLR